MQGAYPGGRGVSDFGCPGLVDALAATTDIQWSTCAVVIEAPFTRTAGSPWAPPQATKPTTAKQQANGARMRCPLAACPPPPGRILGKPSHLAVCVKRCFSLKVSNPTPAAARNTFGNRLEPKPPESTFALSGTTGRQPAVTHSLRGRPQCDNNIKPSLAPCSRRSH